MKLYFMIFVAVLISGNFCEKIPSNYSLVSDAIDGILHEYFANETHKIDVVCVSEKLDLQNEKLVDRALHNKNNAFTLKVSKFAESSKIKLNTSSIVVFDSTEKFQKMKSKIDWQTHPSVRYPHLVHILNANLRDLQQTKFENDFSIDKVDFIINTNKSIELVTSFMFSEHACMKNQLQTINKFDRKLMKWETSNFYPNKYKNLHRCKLYYQFIDIPELLAFGIHTKIFAKLINSTSVHISEPDVAYLTIAQWPQANHFDFGNSIIYGNVYMFDKYIILLPPGELYTSLEKLIAPFEKELWIAITITMSIGFVTIQIINRTKTKIKQFVFGSSIKSPTMNFFSIILVGSQVKTPGRNFARFLFVLFVIWCLIIRTCHQSMLFESLQSLKRKPQVERIEDVVRKNIWICEYMVENKMDKIIDELKKMGAKMCVN